MLLRILIMFFAEEKTHFDQILFGSYLLINIKFIFLEVDRVTKCANCVGWTGLKWDTFLMKIIAIHVKYV